MYKTKLQELCQGRGWELPEYATLKTGSGHMTLFTAIVKVKDDVFETPEKFRSSKEAQNTAAHIAFEHFTITPPSARVNHPIQAVPGTASVSTVAAATQATAISRNFPASPLASSLPIPSPGLVPARSAASIKSANTEALPQNCEESTQASMCYKMPIGSLDKSSKDTLHMYKNMLQQYGQKHSLGFPVYTCEAEGPPHNRRFKSRVSLDGKSYETLEFFTTVKEAEQAAAKVACQKLSIDAIQEEGCLYKNLLQELARKMGLLCPSYKTAGYGLSHRPVFLSTVEIGSDTFRGGEAFTKKQAEMNAAKVAYLALIDRCRAKESSTSSSIGNGSVDDNLKQSIQPSDVVKQQHQDVTHEEVQARVKRARSGDKIENSHSPAPSNGDLPHSASELGHSTLGPFEPFKEPSCC